MSLRKNVNILAMTKRLPLFVQVNSTFMDSTRIFTLMVCFLLFVACGKQATNKDVQTIYHGIQTLETMEKRDPVDTLFLTSSPNVSVYVSDGNICKIYRKIKESPLRIEITDFEGSILYKYDSSSDQFISAIATKNGNTIILHDNLIGKTALFDINASIDQPNYHPKIRTTDFSSERVIKFKNKLAFLNKNSYEEGYPRVLFTREDWQNTNRLKTSFNSGNVIHGEIICDKVYKTIVYIPKHENTIEIMDEKGVLKTTVVFPHEKKQGISSFEINGNRIYAFTPPSVKCFSAACAGKELFIVGYIDDNADHSILLLDWSGSFISGFQVEGEIIKISLSPDDKTIYSWQKKGDNYSLVKYNTERL